MDRDTLQDDLDQVLGTASGAELPGEWDWEPPLGTGVPAASSATEPEEAAEGTDPEASSDPEEGSADDEDEDEEEEEDD